LKPSSIPSTDYTREYYEENAAGHEEFALSKGKLLTGRHSIPFSYATVKPGQRILDVGSGRGELVYQSTIAGAQACGIDYAYQAVRMATDALCETLPPEMQGRAAIQQANAQQLPYASNTFDTIFMLDVVEHLLPAELESVLREARRVLRPGGRVIIHTMPNLWYYHYGYPLYRLAQGLRGQVLPANPRSRWKFAHVHVNEQTPTRLRKMLLSCGFKAKVWLESAQDYSYEKNKFVFWAMNALNKAYPFRYIFCNDIFAIGEK
jgi:ubiquinone/menaquinone biosynthesis C-methylase UbiE